MNGRRTRLTDDRRPWEMTSRIDPFHLQLLWEGGVGFAWDSVRVSEEMRSLNSAGTHVDPLIAKADGVDRRAIWDDLLSSSGTYPPQWQVLGMLGQHRAATTDQIACCLGLGTKTLTEVLPKLWLAGLIRRGRTFAASTMGSRSSLPVLWKLDHPVKVSDLASKVPVPALLTMTGGKDLTVGPSGDAHNLLATEVMLRIAEHVDGALTIVGEHSASLQALRGLPVTTTQAPDFVVVRSDRLKIAVEVTRTTNTSTFRTKVERWAEFLRDAGGEWVVLFVDANHPRHKVNKYVASMWRKVLDSSSMTVSERDRVASRVGVVEWGEWFPARHQVSTGFADLAARFPTDARFTEFVERPTAVEFEVPYSADGTDDSWIERSAILSGTPWKLAARLPKPDPWSFLGDPDYRPFDLAMPPRRPA